MAAVEYNFSPASQSVSQSVDPFPLPPPLRPKLSTHDGRGGEEGQVTRGARLRYRSHANKVSDGRGI